MNIRSHEVFEEQRRMSIGDMETNDPVTSQVPEESNEMDRREGSRRYSLVVRRVVEKASADGQFSLFFVIKMMNPSE